MSGGAQPESPGGGARPGEQLTFDLAPREPPSFANFLPGRNAEAVDALIRMGNGAMAETGLVLWGAPGTGKTHLLQATAAAVAARGQGSRCVDASAIDVAQTLPADLALLAVDDIDAASPGVQAWLFTAFNALRARGGRMVVASRTPPATLALREDLRTRLGWGLVYELVSLSDDEKPGALIAYARSRGFTLTDDVVRYLLGHGRRDMTTLVATVVALDRESLQAKRPVTVPMLRDWLGRHGTAL